MNANRLVKLQSYFPDAKVHVFGSVLNESVPSNDIDLLIVSEGFHGIRMPKRTEMVLSILEADAEGIICDPVCVTPDELRRIERSESAFSQSMLKSIRDLNHDDC